MANGNLEKQPRRRWRNGKWELWHPNVSVGTKETGSRVVPGQKDSLLDLASFGDLGTKVAPWLFYPDSHEAFESIGERVVEEGERIWVDEYGTDFEVGNLDDTYTAFTSGGCHIFAAVAHEETGWPIIALGYKECVNGCSPETFYDAEQNDEGDLTGSWCDCSMTHFYVGGPDGGLWDVGSVTDAEAVLDDSGQYELREVPDEVFAVVLSGWGSSPDLVGWARKQIAETDFESPDYSLFS